jgi:alkylation response protein AidB-like acyl-CoA dehydrogenase
MLDHILLHSLNHHLHDDYPSPEAFDITRPLVAAAAVGLSQRALEEATMYAQGRKVSTRPLSLLACDGHDS